MGEVDGHKPDQKKQLYPSTEEEQRIHHGQYVNGLLREMGYSIPDIPEKKIGICTQIPIFISPTFGRKISRFLSGKKPEDKPLNRFVESMCLISLGLKEQYPISKEQRVKSSYQKQRTQTPLEIDENLLKVLTEEANKHKLELIDFLFRCINHGMHLKNLVMRDFLNVDKPNYLHPGGYAAESTFKMISPKNIIAYLKKNNHERTHKTPSKS